MQIVVAADYEALSRAAADQVAALTARNPAAAVLLPTGNTPIGLYRDLASRQARGEYDGSHLRVFQLDSYLGLTPGDPRCLSGWLDRECLLPLGIALESAVRLPEDTYKPEDIADACRAYDQAVANSGGLDLSVLGLGLNGHLGFNEPPSGAATPTRAVTLTAESIQSNGAYWGGPDQVPRRALTAGMTVLLAARQTLLLVSGTYKQDILHRMLHGPVTPDLPASYLREADGVTLIADRAALPSAWA